MKRANAPGNVALKKGEANLPKKSVVNISQIFTVNKSELLEKIDPERGGISHPKQAEPELEECICEELRSIKRLNGTVPKGKQRNWWNHYGCGPYIA